MKIKIQLLTTLIIILIVLLACQGNYNIRVAKLAMKTENNPDKALQYLHLEIENNPTNAEAYLYMSQIYYQFKKDYFNSFKYAKKTIELDSTKTKDVNKMFKACWDQSYKNGAENYNEKKYEEALKFAKLGNKIYPDSIKTINLLARVYAKLDSVYKAMEIYETIIAKKLPNDINSRIYLADTYFFKKEYENAIKFFKELFNIEPPNADWPFNIAVCYSNLNNLEKAFEYYKKAIELDPYNKEIIYKIAHNEFNNENYNEAIKYYQKIIEINEDEIDAIEFIARSYWFIKDYENLIEYSKKWSELDPENENAVLFMNLGIQKLEESKNK